MAKQSQNPTSEVESKPVVLRAFDFSGGLNSRVINSLLKPNEVYLLENGFFDIVGAIRKRGGSTLFGTIGHASVMQTMFRFYVSNGNKYHLWADVDGHVGWITDDGLTPTTLATLSASPLGQFNTAADNCIFTNGVDVPQTITSGPAIAPLGGTPPIAQFSNLFGGSLFLSGVGSNASTLYFSASGTITNWPATNTITVGPNDGSIIRGLIQQFGLLAIFKDNSIYTVSGDSSTNFTLTRQQSKVGCLSSKTLGDMSGIIFFLGRQGSRLGVFTYINGIVTRISQNVDNIIQGINLAALSKACAYVDFPYYYLSIPTGNSTINNVILMFDASINAWSTFTNIQANCFSDWSGGSDAAQLFYGDGNATGKIVQHFWGSPIERNFVYQDMGNPYLFRFRTKYFDFDVQEAFKRNRVFYLTKESAWPNTGVIQFDFDFLHRTSAYVHVIALTNQNWGMFALGDQGQFCSFEFADFSSNLAVVSGFSLLGEQFPVRPQ